MREPSSTPPRLGRVGDLLAGFVLLGASAFVAQGCGGASAKDAPPTMSVSSLDDAQAELDRAEAKLGPLLGGGAVTTSDPQPAPPPTGPQTPERLEHAPANVCETACDALASMKRAADRICALDADRCSAARDRVTKATERVTSRCHDCEP